MNTENNRFHRLGLDTYLMHTNQTKLRHITFEVFLEFFFLILFLTLSSSWFTRCFKLQAQALPFSGTRFHNKAQHYSRRKYFKYKKEKYFAELLCTTMQNDPFQNSIKLQHSLNIVAWICKYQCCSCECVTVVTTVASCWVNQSILLHLIIYILDYNYESAK